MEYLLAVSSVLLFPLFFPGSAAEASVVMTVLYVVRIYAASAYSHLLQPSPQGATLVRPVLVSHSFAKGLWPSCVCDGAETCEHVAPIGPNR